MDRRRGEEIRHHSAVGSKRGVEVEDTGPVGKGAAGKGAAGNGADCKLAPGVVAAVLGRAAMGVGVGRPAGVEVPSTVGLVRPCCSRPKSIPWEHHLHS